MSGAIACQQPGCPEVSDRGHCAAHRPPRHAPARPAWRRKGDTRTTTERGYGWPYQKSRAYVLATRPICEHCHDAASVETNHRLPVAKGGGHHPSNLEALCKPCHRIVTQRASEESRQAASSAPQPSLARSEPPEGRGGVNLYQPPGPDRHGLPQEKIGAVFGMGGGADGDR